MKNANEKYIEYARVIQMCKGTKFENEPWKCIRGGNYNRSPAFGGLIDLEFAVAILEDEPLFLNDTIYWKHDGRGFDWTGGSISVDKWDNWVTRTPPKRTFTLNGVELPCPNDTPNGFELQIIGFNDNAYHFNNLNDIKKVENAINRILEEAAK